MIGKTRWELAVDEDDRSLWRSHREDLEAHRAFRDFVYAANGKDGDVRHMKVSGTPVFDDDGVFTGYRGSAVDVTAEVNARREFADIRSKFSTALENITEGLAVWDSDDQFIYCNSFFRFVHPWAAATLLPGMRFDDFVGALVKGGWGSKSGISDSEWVERRLGNFRTAGSALVDSLDGKWIQTRTEKLRDGSTAVLVSDITEQKRREEALRESEERFRKSFEDAAIGMAIVGLEGQLRLVNRAFSEMVGYSASELIAKTISEITHPDDVEVSDKLRAKILKGERSDHPQEKRYIHKNGQVIWVSLTEALIRGADGQNLYTIGQVQDISEHKEAEDRLRQALKMEAVGQLTGGVAHDFNNLLASIIGNLELVANKVQDDTVLRRRIDRAMRSAKAGGVLTNRLLAFSRRQNLEPCQTNIGDLIENTLDLLNHSVSEAIEIRTDFAPDLLPTLVDQNQLENALLNLAINARDAMPIGGQLSFQGSNACLERSYSRYFGRIDEVELILTDVVLSNGNSGPEIAKEAVRRRPDLGVLMMTGYAEQDVLLGSGNKSLFPILKKPFQIGELGRELNSVVEGRQV
ncbi:MAG: PAS domain S-box protein [Proteobacteria bacterium]|nr:PAS domain S-box protein [Pseudomonadota bacterium]